MRTLWLARHANRIDFVDPQWARSASRPHDPPLSPDGVHQARELAARLASEPISHVFSSPFLRCVETAAIIAELLDSPIKLESGLSEWLNPRWFSGSPEIHPREELHRSFPRIDPSYVSRVEPRYPETDIEALARSGKTASRLTEEFPGNLLLVGHGASVRGATESLLGLSPGESVAALLWPEMPLCCVAKLGWQRGREWRLELPCDTSHLTRVEGGRRFY